MKVAQSCLTLCDPTDYTVHGILQARILEWVSLSLLQGIFPTQESNQGLLHCKWVLYQLSYQGAFLPILCAIDYHQWFCWFGIWQAKTMHILTLLLVYFYSAFFLLPPCLLFPGVPLLQYASPHLRSQTPLQHAFVMEGLYVPMFLIHLLPKFKTYLTCASFSQLSAKSDLITCHVMVFNGFVIYFLSRASYWNAKR